MTDYLGQLQRSRRLPDPPPGAPRVALVGDVSLQILAPLLRLELAERGLPVALWEAPFGGLMQQALDPGSHLRHFGPDVIVVVLAAEGLRDRYFRRADGPGFVNEVLDETRALWGGLQRGKAGAIVQTTFVPPMERPFGSYGHRLGTATFGGAIAEINARLRAAAQETPGVFLADIDNLASDVGRQQFLDRRHWVLAHALCAPDLLPRVARRLAAIVGATQGRVVKCVVCDLDNTLWGGIVAEDGIEGLALGDLDEGDVFRDFQWFLKSLRNRGVLLAVCSKNDEVVARRVFREHPGMVLTEADIAAFVANWEDKATNIRRIQQRLNIGLDSMVFLDDSTFERNLVRSLLPDVVVPELPEDPAYYLSTIESLDLFETTTHSAEDALRTDSYLQEERRQQAAAQAGSLEGYLQALETTAIVGRFSPTTIGRVAQLLQRSNQFNLTTRRYTEADCRNLADDPATLPFWVRVSDRFGDFGIVAVVIARRRETTLEIDTFAMSCRVLQRGVERLAIDTVFEAAARMGLLSVTGIYRPTAKNGMVESFYRDLGFAAAGEIDGAQIWVANTDGWVPGRAAIRRNVEGPLSVNAGFEESTQR